jgi:hypothetical protein
MGKHEIEIKNFNGTLEQLAQEVFKMRYDKIAQFLFFGMNEMHRQYEGDKKAGKVKLSMLSLLALYKIGELIAIMMKIFIFCKPFMKDELMREKEKNRD